MGQLPLVGELRDHPVFLGGKSCSETFTNDRYPRLLDLKIVAACWIFFVGYDRGRIQTSRSFKRVKMIGLSGTSTLQKDVFFQ